MWESGKGFVASGGGGGDGGGDGGGGGSGGTHVWTIFLYKHKDLACVLCLCTMFVHIVSAQCLSMCMCTMRVHNA